MVLAIETHRGHGPAEKAWGSASGKLHSGMDAEIFQRGLSQEVWRTNGSPVESMGKASVRNLGDQVPQKLKKNVLLLYIFHH